MSLYGSGGDLVEDVAEFLFPYRRQLTAAWREIESRPPPAPPVQPPPPPAADRERRGSGLVRLTVAQASAETGRHEVTLWRALESGELHGLQRVRGGRWLIHPDCLDAWLDDRPCAHQPPGSQRRVTKSRTTQKRPRPPG